MLDAVGAMVNVAGPLAAEGVIGMPGKEATTVYVPPVLGAALEPLPPAVLPG